MTITLRVVLLIVSVLNVFWIVYNIKKSAVRIEDSIFWIFFSIVLVILSIFPQIVLFGARVTGVQTPVNFIFLIIIFILLIKLFRMTISISQLESKINTLTQTIAIMKYNDESKK
ncbi:MAG: DUF2304 domain-containing protein [Eubacteriales bacterium]|nr:DUF2304 domain-containing protein [Eubacteriales bacterium]